MANLAISNVCNLSCPYCFAAEYLGIRQSAAQFMSLAQYDALLDFLDRSGIKQARLLGGEPTLHPEFPTMIEKACARGKEIMVFSNGLMPGRALEAILQVPEEACLVLINANAPDDIGAAAVAKLKQNLRRLGKRAMIGFNIYRTDFEAGFLLDLIAETDCLPRLRLGMAQRCLTDDNQYIHPRQYRMVAEKILPLIKAAAQRDIHIEFDCGFVRCMFSDDEIQLLRDCGVEPVWHCGPTVDVDIHGQAVACYPLSAHHAIFIDVTTTFDGLRQAFKAKTAPFREAGIYPECSTCPFKAAGQCSGGCLAATMHRFHTPVFQLTLEEKSS